MFNFKAGEREQMGKKAWAEKYKKKEGQQNLPFWSFESRFANIWRSKN